MGISGDFSALAKLTDRISEAKIRGLLPKVAQRIGAAAVKQISDEFRESRDPYGQPWKPLKSPRGRQGKKKRSDKPLIDTGRLRASFRAQPDGATVRVSTDVDYAEFHQDGTSRIPRRQILPDDDGGLGPRWSAAFEKEAEAVLTKALIEGE